MKLLVIKETSDILGAVVVLFHVCYVQVC